MDAQPAPSAEKTSPSTARISHPTLSEYSNKNYAEGTANVSIEEPHSPTSTNSPKKAHSRQHSIFRGSSLLPLVGTSLRPPRLPHFFPTVDFPNQGHGCLSEFNQVPPLWVHQPFKALYTVFFILTTAFLYLPFQALKNISRRGRGRQSWSWKRSMTVVFFRRCISYIINTHVILTKTPPVKEPKVKHSKFVWLHPEAYLAAPPEGASLQASPDFRGEIVRAMELQGVVPERISGYWYFSKGTSQHRATQAVPKEPLLFHLHGGAYWMGSAHESSPNAVMDCALLNLLADKGYDGPTRAFGLEYRLTSFRDFSHGSYPAALVDALVGYLYLTRACGFAPENIILAGDSSGGNLALALCRYLRDEGVAPLPGSLLLFSPWSDVSRSHSGPLQAPNSFSSTLLNRQSDILDPSVTYRNTTVSAFLGKLAASEAYTNPYISPVSLHLDCHAGGCPPHWGLQGFPKRIYISTGSAELNSEQHVTLAHRLAQGTRRGVPMYVGDRLSAGEPVMPLVWRDNYPRSRSVADAHQGTDLDALHPAAPLEDREVVLDEVRDCVHVFPLFLWHEPERTETLERIARWISRKPILCSSTEPL